MAVLVLEVRILIATHFSSPRGMGNLTVTIVNNCLSRCYEKNENCVYVDKICLDLSFSTFYRWKAYERLEFCEAENYSYYP